MKKSAPRKAHRLLSQNSLKKTAFRESLLEVLNLAKEPLAAAQIHQQLLAAKPKGAKFDRATLFRNLKTLTEQGLVTATEFGTGATFYCLNDKHHHHHHIFCVNCETVKGLDSCGVQQMIVLAEQMGFSVLDHRLELMGLCPSCR